MKRKMFTFSAIVAALILLAFYLAPVVTAEDPFASRPHEWTGKQTFRSGAVVNSTNSVNKSTVQFGANSLFIWNGARNSDYGTVALYGEYTPAYVTNVGMTLTAALIAQYNVFRIDTTGSSPCSVSIGPNDGIGCTVTLPTPTAAIDGKEFTIIKIDSGASDIFLYAGGIPIDTGSITTDRLTLDARGDLVTVIADYNSAVSYWFKSTRVH